MRMPAFRALDREVRRCFGTKETEEPEPAEGCDEERGDRAVAVLVEAEGDGTFSLHGIPADALEDGGLEPCLAWPAAVTRMREWFGIKVRDILGQESITERLLAEGNARWLMLWSCV